MMFTYEIACHATTHQAMDTPPLSRSVFEQESPDKGLLDRRSRLPPHSAEQYFCHYNGIIYPARSHWT